MHKQWLLNTQFGQEKKVMAGIKQIFSVYAPHYDRVEDMMTAAAEACLNAFEHGNKMRADARVLVQISIKDDEVRYRVYDEGAGFEYNPAAVRERAAVAADFSQLADRGWGIMLIANLADMVCTGFENNRFFLEMQFFIRERVHNA